MKKLLIGISLFVSLITNAQKNPAERLDPVSKPGAQVETNHHALPDLLKDFYDSAKYYKVDYASELISLNKVILVRADMNFLGGVVEIDGGYEIWINGVLAVQYPNLLEVIFNRQMGILYGLEELKGARGLPIMSDRWELSPRYELWAYNQNQRPTQRKVFFEKLAKKHPLERKL